MPEQKTETVTLTLTLEEAEMVQALAGLAEGDPEIRPQNRALATRVWEKARAALA